MFHKSKVDTSKIHVTEGGRLYINMEDLFQSPTVQKQIAAMARLASKQGTSRGLGRSHKKSSTES